MPEQTIETMHGEVQYETETCASCGFNHKKDEMEVCAVGDTIIKHDSHITVEGRHETQYYCTLCVDDPVKLRRVIDPKMYVEAFFDTFDTYLFVVWSVLMLGIGIWLTMIFTAA